MIFVCGDTHHDYDVKKLTMKKWPEQKELTLDDHLIVLGDFGLPWSNDPMNKQDRYLIEKFYGERRFTTLAIPGNHDNYERIFNLPEIKMFGAKVYRLWNNIFFLKRGEIYEIDGKKIFTMGGGFSIDKARRRNRVSWWEEEIPSYFEMQRGLRMLSHYNNTVDYILSHTCSNTVFKKLNELMVLDYKLYGEEVLRGYFDEIERKVNFKEWHFGHFHDDIVIDKKYFLHYNNKPYKLV
jgi:DNA repair exonuclease SbcCD nuclease subunit